MQADLLHAELAQARRGFEQLVLGEAELRLLGTAEDAVGEVEVAAGVEAQAHALGQRALLREQRIDVGLIVEDDGGAQAPRVRELAGRRVVGAEHDPLAG